MKIRGLWLAQIIFTATLLWNSTAVAQEEPVVANCFDVVEAINFALQGMPHEGVTVISLKDGGETRYMVFVALEAQKVQEGNNTSARWRIIERQGDSLTYCLSGVGTSLEILQSVDTIPGFGSEFGLPGTSKRRCNDESDGPLGSLAVRTWANKELGPSLVQYFGMPFRGTAFSVLIANDGIQGKFPWIALQSRGECACYFARGDDSVFSSDFVLKEDLVQDPSTLTPLE